MVNLTPDQFGDIESNGGMQSGDIIWVVRSGSNLDAFQEYDDLITNISANAFFGAGTNSVLVHGTSCATNSSVCIGTGSTTVAITGQGSDGVTALSDVSLIAIGDTATANSHGSIAIGKNAIAGGTAYDNYENSIAIGKDSTAQNRHSVAIGLEANADGTNAVAIGDQPVAAQLKCISIGNLATSSHMTNILSRYNIAIGDEAYAGITDGATENNIAIGRHAKAGATSTIDEATAIGYAAVCEFSNSVSLGASVTATAVDQLTFGNRALRLGSYATAGVPTASSYTGHVIYVTDGDTGSPCLAVSNGTNWLRIALGSAVASS